MRSQEWNIDLHKRIPLLHFLTIFYKYFKSFTVQRYGINTDVKQHAKSAFCLEPKCMLCFKYEKHFSIFRCADHSIFRCNNSSVTHHFSCKSFIRTGCNIACHTGDRTGYNNCIYHFFLGFIIFIYSICIFFS